MKSLIEFIKEQVNEGLKGPWITVSDIKSNDLSIDEFKEESSGTADKEIDSFLNNKCIRPLLNEDDLESIQRQNNMDEWAVIRFKSKERVFEGGDVFNGMNDDQAFETLYEEALQSGVDDIAGWSWLTGNGLQTISFGAESRGVWDIVTFASEEVLEKMWDKLLSDNKIVAIYQYVDGGWNTPSLLKLWKDEYTKIK